MSVEARAEVQVTGPYLVEQLKNREFETTVPLLNQLFYSMERWLGNTFFRRSPPTNTEFRLLNLGCGPLIYDGWINADDFAFKRQLRQQEFRPNWRLDITKPWKCADEFFDGIFTQHFLEHITYSEAVFVLGECLRVLRPGCWIRVCVPDIEIFAKHYMGDTSKLGEEFPHPAIAISWATQMHLHRSTWDGDLFIRVLSGLGFCNARQVEFSQGIDGRLIQDQPCKERYSLCVEAQKPV